MEVLEKKIIQFVEEVLEEEQDLFLVDMKIKGTVGNQKLLVFIDGDNGLNIDQCGSLSRKLGAFIEEEDLIEGKYLLEVSSPGLDHPIKLRRQYLKNKGRELEVETSEGAKITGELLEVGEENITLKTKEENMKMSFNEINQSKIKVSFK